VLQAHRIEVFMDTRVIARLSLLAGLSLMAVAPGSAAPDSPPAAAASPAPAASAKPSAAAKEGVFTLVNKTPWEIAEVRVTPAEEDTWSGNLLKHKLAAGATAKLTVACDETDVKLVDAKGHVCVSESMYPCGRHSTWTVTSEEIAGCKTFGQ
jgi:hypothetical protein